MEQDSLGYSRALFILPFDHRASFVEKMFGIEGRMPNAAEASQIRDAKYVIYEAFKKALEHDIPKEAGAILVDEQFGDGIIRDAIENGYVVILTVEKSGQEEFAFEYGEDFSKHIEAYHPTFAKALIRYNPEANAQLNVQQLIKLKTLSDYCHRNGYKFLIEPLIIATPEQLSRVSGDKSRYDKELRPDLTVGMIHELHHGGIEPDIWKLEGMENEVDYKKVVEAAQSRGREEVGVIILGRGENKEHVEKWIYTGAKVVGVNGFAVGRTVFWEALVAYKNGSFTKDEARDEIAKNFVHFYTLFITNAADPRVKNI